MIMRDYKGNGVECQSLTDDFPDMNLHPVYRALPHRSIFDQTVRSVEKHDPENLDGQCDHFALEIGSDARDITEYGALVWRMTSVDLQDGRNFSQASGQLGRHEFGQSAG